MKLTSQQKTAVFHNGNIALKSCPGSGKTHTIIAKLLRIFEELTKTTRYVGCITYMNSAVDEIQYRVSMHLGREFDRNCTIETIHSFCLNNIFRQNHWRIHSFINGFRILSPDDDIYKNKVNELIQEYRLDRRAHESFELISRGIENLPPYISQEARYAYWEYLDTNQYVDFDSIIYYSEQLIKEYPFISAGIAAKYAWLLVDEFQDTTGYQVRILRAIASNNKTKFFIVGDPCQSIMGFAGGRPDLMESFGAEVRARDDVYLSGNFRSSRYIVDQANALISRNMEAIGENADYNYEPEWIHAGDIFSGLQDYFIPQVQARHIPWRECAILGPNYYLLRNIARRLIEYDIPIIGPGARPYKRSQHLIAPLAEIMCMYISTNESDVIKSIRRKIYEIIINCENRLPYDAFFFGSDVALAKIIRRAKRLGEITPSALIFLDSFSSFVGDVLYEHALISKKSRDLIVESGRTIVEDIREHNNGLDVENFSIEDLGLMAGGNSLKMLTLHKAKGREFDAVAIINVDDYKIPYGAPPSGSEKENEGRRLFYVGITRARKMLMMFTDSTDRNRPSRFLRELFPNRFTCR